MRYQKVTNGTPFARVLRSTSGAEKRGRRVSSGPSFSGMRLGGQGIGRYRLLMSAGIAAAELKIRG